MTWWRWWKRHHLLAILVYSPRACLWERHVYCAVLSTSMECNIYHGCHSQVEMSIQTIYSLGRCTFCCRISNSFQALKEPNTFTVPRSSETWWFEFEHLKITGPYLLCCILCKSSCQKKATVHSIPSILIHYDTDYCNIFTRCSNESIL